MQGPPTSPSQYELLLQALFVIVKAEAALSPTLDIEAYTLVVPEDGSPAVLTANTQWGALRGLESFAQLAVWQGPDDADNSYAITCAPITINDWPRFPFRGVLIDTR